MTDIAPTKVVGQSKGLSRNTVDKYYTKTSVAKQCVDAVKLHIKIADNDLIIEPSAGNGSFIKFIKQLTDNCKFYDIEPEHTEIIKQDFLKFAFGGVVSIYDNIHIIGNPPFGRQSSLAIQFIKLCCKFSHSISFILPKSFKKDSMKKHFDINFHLLYEIDLPDNAFLVNDEECNVPCVFQIWQHKTEPRIPVIKNIPLKFKFVKKEDDHDISVRRVGVNAGTIVKETADNSLQSHYFIKFTNNETPLDDNIKRLNSLKFEFNNTVGPNSISKPELIDAFNKLLI